MGKSRPNWEEAPRVFGQGPRSGTRLSPSRGRAIRAPAGFPSGAVSRLLEYNRRHWFWICQAPVPRALDPSTKDSVTPAGRAPAAGYFSYAGLRTEVVMSTIRTLGRAGLSARALLILFALVVLVAAPPARTQSQSQSQPQQNPPPPPPGDQASPDSGGPAGDNGAIALPKKKESPDDTPPPAPAAPKLKNPPGLDNYSIRVDVPEVSVDVGVLLEKTGQFVPNLKPTNFRVYENGVEQKVIGFKRVEAPITALMLCEFASINYNYIMDMQNAAWSFAQQLRPQ